MTKVSELLLTLGLSKEQGTVCCRKPWEDREAETNNGFYFVFATQRFLKSVNIPLRQLSSMLFNV